MNPSPRHFEYGIQFSYLKYKVARTTKVCMVTANENGRRLASTGVEESGRGFEMTPQGIKRAEDIAPTEYIRHWSGRKFTALIMTIAMFATGLLMFQLVRTKSAFPANIAVASKPSQKSIAVLPLAPGVIATEMWDRFTGDELRDQVDSIIPVARVGASEEIAAAVLYLCSDNANLPLAHRW